MIRFILQEEILKIQTYTALFLVQYIPIPVLESLETYPF